MNTTYVPLDKPFIVKKGDQSNVTIVPVWYIDADNNEIVKEILLVEEEKRGRN
jgi:hypothetical protein